MIASDAPAVSVVLATRDRADRLERALDALDAQEFDGEVELVVVDDASRDRTPEALAQRVRAAPSRRIRIIRRDSPGGPAGARNTGWRAASAPLIAFTDDDCEPQPGWLASLSAAAAAAPEAVLQGPTEPNPDELHRLGPFSRTIAVRSLGPWFPMSNMAYPRAALERLGGFDESFTRGEDTDLAWRAREAGFEFRWVADALVFHGVVEIGPLGRLRVAAGWAPAFRNISRHRRLREVLYLGMFWKRSHALLLLALFGIVVGRRFPPALMLGLPYARALRAQMVAEHARPWWAPYYALHDAVEIVTALRGSTAARTFVL